MPEPMGGPGSFPGPGCRTRRLRTLDGRSWRARACAAASHRRKPSRRTRGPIPGRHPLPSSSPSLETQRAPRDPAPSSSPPPIHRDGHGPTPMDVPPTQGGTGSPGRTVRNRALNLTGSGGPNTARDCRAGRGWPVCGALGTRASIRSRERPGGFRKHSSPPAGRLRSKPPSVLPRTRAPGTTRAPPPRRDLPLTSAQRPA